MMGGDKDNAPDANVNQPKPQDGNSGQQDNAGDQTTDAGVPGDGEDDGA